MHSIILIIPYFGKWPVWFEAHLLSIAHNPTIDWLFVTDCEVPQNHPANVRFVPSTLETLNSEVNNILEMEVPLSARKLCDIRPAYGVIFQEYISGYDFWGFCDVDIIWGNIRKYITPDLLDKYDIISSLENMISGHFTIFKNGVSNYFLYKQNEDYKMVFSQSKHFRFDEIGLSHIVSKMAEEGEIKVFWDENILHKGIKSEVHQEYFLDRWLYKEGAVYDLFDDNRKEYMYLHFINWKRTMRSSEIKYTANPKQFYISYNRMHYRPHNRLAHGWNQFTNLFDGYYMRLKRKRVRKKGNQFFKRLAAKLN